MNLREDRDERTLESWKEIGAYLQRDARTARNWEKEEGLPIHRHNHNRRRSVYAYPGEIDAWRASRKIAPMETPPARSLWRLPAFALTGLLCLIMVGNGIRPQVASAHQKHTLAKRLLCADCGDWERGLQPGWTLDGVSGLTDAEDLAIRDMSSGKIKRLMANPLPTGTRCALVFPRPELHIFYSTGVKQYTSSAGYAQSAGSRVAGPDRRTGRPATLPTAWAPDGKSVLVILEDPDPVFLRSYACRCPMAR